MKIPNRIIHKIPRIINNVSRVYAKAVADSQKHLLPQLLSALLINPSAYVSDVARKIQGTSIGAKEMKILRFLS